MLNAKRKALLYDKKMTKNLRFSIKYPIYNIG